MEPTTEQMEQLKQTELHIFQAFIKICDQLGLKYYLLGGTMLGAVRHKGFIPWDDDIDIGMLRSDYEIFVAKAQALLPEHIFLQTIDTDPEYLANYAKLRHSGTAFIETAVKDRKINHGIFIDIFPLDHYPDSEKERKRFHRLNKLYTLRIGAEFYCSAKSFKRKAAHCVAKLLLPSVKQALRKRENLMRSYPEGAYIANHCGAWGKKEIVPADWYAEGTILEFEGLLVTAPKNYESWLTQVYGNYMQLPPVEKRKTHHFTEMIDPDAPFTKYI